MPRNYLAKCTFLIILLISCTNNLETKYYPSMDAFVDSGIKDIDLETTTVDFKFITDNSTDFFYSGSRFSLNFLDNDNNANHLIPGAYDSGFFQKKNILVIKSDSIFTVNDQFSIKKLKFLMKRHYANNGENPYYPDSYEMALIELNLPATTNGIVLKEKLIAITKVFDEVNLEISDSLKLNIIFNYEGREY